VADENMSSNCCDHDCHNEITHQHMTEFAADSLLEGTEIEILVPRGDGFPFQAVRNSAKKPSPVFLMIWPVPADLPEMRLEPLVPSSSALIRRD
jgi:hypothetical protein